MVRPRDETSRGWVGTWWRALLAELLATALLVALGCATLVAPGLAVVPLTHPALAFGLLVVANICAFGPASGAHMNPAVTLAALVYGRLPWLPALAYLLAQLAGGVLGFGALLAVTPASVLARGPVAVTLPGLEVSAPAAVAVEATITGVLVLTVCAVWAADDPSRPDHTAPLKIGLVVAGVVYAGGPATGASLNPARSFGPALLQNHWKDHWVYWLGPLGGALLAAALHRWVLARPAPTRPAELQELRQDDKP